MLTQQYFAHRLAIHLLSYCSVSISVGSRMEAFPNILHLILRRLRPWAWYFDVTTNVNEHLLKTPQLEQSKWLPTHRKVTCKTSNKNFAAWIVTFCHEQQLPLISTLYSAPAVWAMHSTVFVHKIHSVVERVLTYSSMALYISTSQICIHYKKTTWCWAWIMLYNGSQQTVAKFN